MSELNYGPLRFLIGKWQSDGFHGQNRAPNADREVENTKFRQEMTFEPIGDVNNHEQLLFVLRYHTKAWEEGGGDKSFHEEVGYFIWDNANRQVMKSFIVPRGISVNAGGTADVNDTEFLVSADLGSNTYGICSNQFLDQEFQTLHYEIKFEFIDEETLNYSENTQIKIKNKDKIFDHTEKNTLKKLNKVVMNKKPVTIPDSTAVRVALWRALHVEVDSKPHVLEDEIGLKLVAPEEGWRNRPDMHPQGTAPFRASIVARARFIEDFVTEEQTKNNLSQYVILGAGLDTFAQRKPEVASQLKIFEIEKPATQEWKRQRLIEIGFQLPTWLKFVPVDFEAKQSWWDQLVASGFDEKKSAVVTSIGVSMYLTLEAIKQTLLQMTKLAPGSKFIMTFMLPLDLVDSADRIGYERSLKGAQASGTPFISFFTPQEMLNLTAEFGFKKIEHLSTSGLTPKYFSGRTDGLRPSTGEELLIVTI